MIYCVEDEQNICELEVYTLQSVGFEAKGCSSGNELFAELEKELPKLILLDIMLPDEDGLNILRRLRSDERYAHIPVIMATAKGTEFDKVKGLNVKGLFCCTKAAVDHMLEQGSGVVLNTSSMVGRDGSPAGVAYPTSKFAVNGLTLSLARELGPKGIRVNAVAPGITETDMMRAVPTEVIDPLIAQIPLKRLGTPEDIANAFVFLASDEASYITGAVLPVDGLGRS